LNKFALFGRGNNVLRPRWQGRYSTIDEHLVTPVTGAVLLFRHKRCRGCPKPPVPNKAANLSKKLGAKSNKCLYQLENADKPVRLLLALLAGDSGSWTYI